MNPCHFMRIFHDIVGVTSYQYLLQTRPRHVAIALGTTREPISAVAFDAGFGDLSTSRKCFAASSAEALVNTEWTFTQAD